MSERRRNEKNEKQEEKEEKGRSSGDEKSWEEKWRRDPVNVVTWAFIFIWIGLVILAETTDFAYNFDWWIAWAVGFAGAGIIILLGTIFRFFLPEYRKAMLGSAIWGLVFLGIGLGEIIGWTIIWAIVPIAIGVVILLRFLVFRRGP